MNISSVQSPRPVSLSGVRLAVKLTPQGPANDVMVAAPVQPQGPGGSACTGGIASCCGWPLSMRVMSGSGPFAPIFHGVWQSLQPPNDTRYSPRATPAGTGAAVSAGAPPSPEASALRAVARASSVENRVSVRIRNARVSRLLDIVISFNVTTPL